MTHAKLNGNSAALRWPATAVPVVAWLELPPGLQWGHNNPIVGWCSSGLGRRVPSFTLLGRGRSAAGEPFRTRLGFVDAEIREESPFTRSAVSWGTSNARGQKMRGN
jgi:hypothetical protein